MATDRQIFTPKIDKFEKEILEVCKKHGFSISHEDEHGAFIIVPYDESHSEWFKGSICNLPRNSNLNLHLPTNSNLDLHLF